MSDFPPSSPSGHHLPSPRDLLGGHHRDRHRRSALSPIRLAEADTGDAGQQPGNAAEAHGDGAQDAGLAVRIVTMQNRQLRV